MSRKKNIKSVAKPKNEHANSSKSKSKSRKKRAGEAQNWLDNLNSGLLNKSSWFLYAGLLLSLILGLLLFDVKADEGGDDSFYVIRAYDFVTQFKYPSFQGALYPLFLSVFISIFGIKLPLLKLTSLVLLILHLWFFYRTFRLRVPALVFFTTFVIISLNSFILYYGSQTYSEAFFMFLQIATVFVFFKYFIDRDSEKIDIKHFMILSAMLFFMSITKNIAYVVPIAVFVYFAIQRQWRNLGLTAAVYAGFLAVFEALKRLIWGADQVQISSQGGTLLLKHPFDPNKGNEDFLGFLQRFIDNSNIYLSKHLYSFLGFRAEITTTSPWLTVLTYVLFIVGVVLFFRKNKHLLFIAIYVATILGASFFALQKIWDTSRLLLPYFPFILLFLFATIYQLFSGTKVRQLKLILPVISLGLVFSVLGTTITKVNTHKEVISRNIRGDLLYGFTPDWVNYIKMSKWVAQNVDDTVVVAARKPSLSFIYAGRRFHGIYKLPTTSVDSIIAKISGKDYAVIQSTHWQANNTNQALYMAWQRYNVGYITAVLKSDPEGQILETFSYEVYLQPDTILYSALEEQNMSYMNDISGVLQIFEDAENKADNSNLEITVIDPDLLVDELKAKDVKYVIMGNLRKFEAQKTQYTINTIRRYMYYIQRKYPEMLRQVHQIGTDEEAYLFEILY